MTRSHLRPAQLRTPLIFAASVAAAVAFARARGVVDDFDTTCDVLVWVCVVGAACAAAAIVRAVVGGASGREQDAVGRSLRG